MNRCLQIPNILSPSGVNTKDEDLPTEPFTTYPISISSDTMVDTLALLKGVFSMILFCVVLDMVHSSLFREVSPERDPIGLQTDMCSLTANGSSPFSHQHGKRSLILETTYFVVNE